MSRTVRCPNCGRLVGVPAQVTGQIVRCLGCGKGLKLVKKGGGAVTGSGLSSLEAGLAADEPPQLDSSCALCGNTVDASELIEDRGQLICRDCAAKVRSDSGQAPLETAP